MLVNELCLLNVWLLKLASVRVNVIWTLLSEGCLYVEPRKGLTGINISELSLSL
jgi:hypothetical protein